MQFSPGKKAIIVKMAGGGKTVRSVGAEQKAQKKYSTKARPKISTSERKNSWGNSFVRDRSTRKWKNSNKDSACNRRQRDIRKKTKMSRNKETIQDPRGKRKGGRKGAGGVDDRR